MAMYECDHAGLELFDRARDVFVTGISIDAGADSVFAVLEDADVWPEWVDAITSVVWTSPRPFAPGTTRTITLQGNITVDEEFFVWEQNRRFAFRFTRMSRPLFKALVEEYQLSESPDGHTEVRWRVAFVPRGLLAALMPIVRPLLTRYNRKSLSKLKAYVESQAKS